MVSEDLDLSTLRLLLAIRDHGSVSRAAVARGISQPAASARIRDFETQWRLGLVQRTSRGSRLTADGRVVAAWAEELIGASDHANRSLLALRSQRRTRLVVAASETLAEHLAPRWLGLLAADHPEIVAKLVGLPDEAVLQAVDEDQVDLGFVESGSLPAELTQRVVARDRLEIVVHPTHAWARRRHPVCVSEMRSARWVLAPSGSDSRRRLELVLQTPPLVAVEARSTAALVRATVSGSGPAATSVLSVRSELRSGRLVRVPHTLDLRRDLSCVWKAGQRLSDPARMLVVLATRRPRGQLGPGQASEEPTAS